MGWLFGWNSKAELVQHLTAESKRYDLIPDAKGCIGMDGQFFTHSDHPNPNKRQRTLKHSTYGNTLYTVQVNEFRKSEESNWEEEARFIGVYLLSGKYDQGSCGRWGYKDMDESMGPCECAGCPLYFFDMVPEPPNEYAASWRENVRNWHKKRKVGTNITNTIVQRLEERRKAVETIQAQQSAYYSGGVIERHVVEEYAKRLQSVPHVWVKIKPGISWSGYEVPYARIVDRYRKTRWIGKGYPSCQQIAISAACIDSVVDFEEIPEEFREKYLKWA